MESDEIKLGNVFTSWTEFAFNYCSRLICGLIANFVNCLNLVAAITKTFLLYLDYICLLTYLINCIFPTAANIHIYLLLLLEKLLCYYAH